MANMEKMCEIIEMEIDKIADKGLTTSNLETAYKLIDMYKDLKTVEGMEDYEGYSGNYDERGNSYRRHYVKGHYSRDNDYADNSMNRYQQAKRMYRNNHSMASKQDMMDSLEEHMEDFTSKLEAMRRDADTSEERDMIDKYINRIKQR